MRKTYIQINLRNKDFCIRTHKLSVTKSVKSIHLTLLRNAKVRKNDDSNAFAKSKGKKKKKTKKTHLRKAKVIKQNDGFKAFWKEKSRKNDSLKAFAKSEGAHKRWF